MHSEPEHAIPRSPYQLLLLSFLLSQCDLSTYPDWQISELKELNLSGCSLSVLPGDVALWSKLASLKKIDLNGNLLKDLPAALEVLAPSLEIMFLSENLFQVVPEVIGRLARLRLLSLRGNKLRELTTVNLPSNSLEWLILTNNRIERIDTNVRDLIRLRKLMLSHNLLDSIPTELAECKALELVRLASNRIAAPIPSQVAMLPKLAWISLSGNPIFKTPQMREKEISENDITLDRAAVLGKGASGMVFRGKYNGQDVAVKMFKDQSTGSDGNAIDEAAINGLVSHPLAVSAIGVLRSEDNPGTYSGMVMDLLRGTHSLGKVPSFETVTRDAEPALHAKGLTNDQVYGTIWNVASALKYIHSELGLSHGDIYLHNILQDGDGVARLSDWGGELEHIKLSHLTFLTQLCTYNDLCHVFINAASFVYDRKNVSQALKFQKIEVLAFGRLVQDLFEWHMQIAVPDSTEPPYRGKDRGRPMGEGPLYDLIQSILQPDQGDRPTFDDIKQMLSKMPEFEEAIKTEIVA